ncbi:uncharacterized protein V6R79_007569 [Siganus canaliculatus]
MWDTGKPLTSPLRTALTGSGICTRMWTRFAPLNSQTLIICSASQIWLLSVYIINIMIRLQWLRLGVDELMTLWRSSDLSDDRSSEQSLSQSKAKRKAAAALGVQSYFNPQCSAVFVGSYSATVCSVFLGYMEAAIKTLVMTYLKFSGGKDNLDKKSFQKLVSKQLGGIMEDANCSSAVEELKHGLDANNDNKVNFQEYLTLIGYLGNALSERQTGASGGAS